jgi:uncharacterized protein YigA (DUF484 family)
MADSKGLPDREVKPRPAEVALSGLDVARYLTEHPDFLTEHSELLAVLTPPVHRRGDNVVDLQRYQVERLQHDLGALKTAQKTLIGTSRANLASQYRIHQAVLAVIGANRFDHLMQIVTTDIAVMLDVDIVTLGVESETEIDPPLSGIRVLPTDFVDSLFGNGKDVMLEDHVRGDPAIFGSGAGLVRSEALIRIEIANGPMGLLALGSRRATKFRPGNGTELLGFLGKALALTIGQWLDLGP